MRLIALLIEDSILIREHLTSTLRDLAGVDVVACAETEAQAIAMLGARHWDLVIVDLFLKEGSGMGVLRTLNGRPAGKIAAVLTNYPTEAMRQRCAALGADVFFDKSTELEAFIDYCLGLGRLASLARPSDEAEESRRCEKHISEGRSQSPRASDGLDSTAGRQNVRR